MYKLHVMSQHVLSMTAALETLTCTKLCSIIWHETEMRPTLILVGDRTETYDLGSETEMCRTDQDMF